MGHGGPPLPGRASARSDATSRRGGDDGGTTACSARATTSGSDASGAPEAHWEPPVVTLRSDAPGLTPGVCRRYACPCVMPYVCMICVRDCDCLTAADPNVLPRALVRPTGMRFRTRPRSQRGLRSDIKKKTPPIHGLNPPTQVAARGALQGWRPGPRGRGCGRLIGYPHPCMWMCAARRVGTRDVIVALLGCADRPTDRRQDMGICIFMPAPIGGYLAAADGSQATQSGSAHVRMADGRSASPDRRNGGVRGTGSSDG